MNTKWKKLLSGLLCAVMLQIPALTEGLVSYSAPKQVYAAGSENFGTFSIKNNGNNTFTISRTGGSDGVQTVYYRTVNGSAVGGTHFTHTANAVTFAAGVTSKTVTVNEYDTHYIYNGTPSTAYSNADRTYQLEIYRVDGGAKLGEITCAARTMEKKSDYAVDSTIYSEYKEQSRLDEVRRGDHDRDKLGWEKGSAGSANAKETITIKDTPGFAQTEYWKNTADAIKFRLQFDAVEGEAGYQHI